MTYRLSLIMCCGITPFVTKWIEPFLNRRSFQLDFKGRLFQVTGAICGDPQVSVSGLILYAIYANDLTENLTTCLILMIFNSLPWLQPTDSWSSFVAGAKWPEDWESVLHPAKIEHLSVGDNSNPFTHEFAPHPTPNSFRRSALT